MIIKKAYTSKEKSIYRCDICKELFEKDYIHGIYYQSSDDRNPVKKIDLCDKDYKIAIDSIRKWLNKK